MAPRPGLPAIFKMIAQERHRVRYLAVACRLSPYLIIYRVDDGGRVLRKLANPATLPPSQALRCVFSNSGVYLAFVHTDVSPYLTIYKRSDSVFTKLANPATLPANAADAAFTPDGSYLAVAQNVSPYITIYQRSGDVFTKIADPSVLPSSIGRGCAFSSDGAYLAVAHNNGVKVYSRSGSTFTSVADLLTGRCDRVAFSLDTTYLAVVRGGGSSTIVSVLKRSGDVFTLLSLYPLQSSPPSQVSDASFAPNGKYVAITHLGSPYVSIFERSGDTFNRLANPANLPSSAGQSCAFSADGLHLAVGLDSSPFIIWYRRNGATFTKLNDPTDLPPDDGYGVCFWPLAVPGSH